MINRLVSPNEIMRAAKAAMLDGKEPSSVEDYQRIMNFLAANLEPDIALSACQLMRTIYEMPIAEVDVIAIVTYQLDKKKE